VNAADNAAGSRPGAPSIAPYRTTPIFDRDTLPEGLRREHRTKPGVWGIIEVLEGRLLYEILAPPSVRILDPDSPGRILPDQPHRVTPLSALRMRVAFYDRDPGV
jgi:tellurite resistance-related uncharacterized protein